VKKQKIERRSHLQHFLTDDQRVALTVYAEIRGLLFASSDPRTGERLLFPSHMPSDHFFPISLRPLTHKFVNR
jgi:hypothetical protein